MSDEQVIAPVDTSVPVESTETPVESQEQAVANLEAKPQEELTKAEKKYLKSLKIKVDSKEIEEELPFEIPDDPKAVEYMRKQLQMAKMGNNRAQQYKQLETEVQQFIQELRDNPRKALSNPLVGVDVKELAKAVLEEEIANSKKTPEQIEKEKLENELQELRKQAEREREEFKQKEIERLTQLETERYDNLLTEALTTSNLPKNGFVLKKIADYMLVGLEAGIDVDPADVIPLVKADLEGDIKEMIGAMPDEALEAFLGQERMKKIRSKNINKAKQDLAKKVASKPVDVAKAAPKEKKEEAPKSYKDFFGF